MSSDGVLNKKPGLRNAALLLLAAALVFALPACGAPGPQEEPQLAEQCPVSDNAQAKPAPSAFESAEGVMETDAPTDGYDVDTDDEEDTAVTELKMTIDGKELSVVWEENESTAALAELVGNGPLTVHSSPYGGFEQVGSIGQSLPRNDVQITAKAGDIVLYSGDRIVVFYGSNSWAYTRLGHIADMTPRELKELLGNGGVEITISR